MNILFAGGEDIDFNAGSSQPTVSTTAALFRAGWARCAVRAGAINLVSKSNAFLGGAVTSCWFSFQIALNENGTSGQRYVGLISSATPSSGLWVAEGTTVRKIAIAKYDGTTMTQLAQSAVDVWPVATQAMNRVDVQVINYGVSATVTVFVNGSSVVTYTGDVTVTGVTNLDAAAIGCVNSNTATFGISEFVVADSDTRALQGVQTLALTGAGTTNGWTNNTFTNINGTTLSDTNPTSVNTTGTNQQYNVTDPTPVVFSVTAVVQSARMAKSATSTPTAVKLGVNSGGTVAFGTGASKTLTTSYASYQQIDQVNPATGNPFTSSELTALQLNMQSA